MAAAFKNIQQSKSVVLNEALDKNLNLTAHGEDPLFQQERQLRNQLLEHKLALINLKFEDAEPRLQKEQSDLIFTMEERYVKLLAEIQGKAVAPDSKSQSKLADIQDVQASLSDSSLFVEYFYGDELNELFILAVSKTGVSFHRRLLASNFTVHLQGFLKDLKNWDFVENFGYGTAYFRTFTKTGYDLYQLLIAPVYDLTKYADLIVSPDGLLNFLPFELLLTASSASPDVVDFANLPYVLHEVPIHAEYSATTMLAPLLPNSRLDALPEQNYLGVAPDYAASSYMNALSYNKPTTERLKKRFGGRLLADDEAGKDRFKEAMQERRYKVSHFYGHANAIPDSPVLSWMALSSAAQSPNVVAQDLNPARNTINPDRQLLSALSDLPKSEHASLLYLFDIYSMRLTLDLVVLSACKTGDGLVAPGEGIINMAWAFRYAGCPSALISLWEANDQHESVARITELFFSFLETGVSKSRALQLAKIEYVKEAGLLAHPAFWSSFVLIVDDSPIEFLKYDPAVEGPGYYRYLIIGTLILGLWWWTRKKWRR